MNLSHLLTLELAQFAPAYAACATEHPSLAAYPTLTSLAHRFADPDNNDRKERSQLVLAAVIAYRQTHDRLWTAVLVAAFLPRLQAAGLYGADADEREAVFFAALFRIVEKVDVREKAKLVDAVLWRGAKKALVRKLKVHAAWNEIGFGEEVAETPDDASTLSELLLAAWLLSRKGGEDRPDLDLVVRVEEWGSLRAYIKAEFPHLPATEREILYRQLRKRRRESIAELRDALVGSSSDEEPLEAGRAQRVDAEVTRPVSRIGDASVPRPVSHLGDASVPRPVSRPEPAVSL